MLQTSDEENDNDDAIWHQSLTSVPAIAWPHPPPLATAVAGTQAAHRSARPMHVSRSQSDLDADCEDNDAVIGDNYDTSSIVSASELLSVHHDNCRDGQSCTGDRRHGCIADPARIQLRRKTQGGRGDDNNEQQFTV